MVPTVNGMGAVVWETVIENLDDQGRVPEEGWFGGRGGLRGGEGPGTGQEDISGSSRAVSQILHLASLSAYATLIQKSPEDSDPSLLPLTHGFMSKCPDFMVTYWSPPGAPQKWAPAVPWSSNTRLPLSPPDAAPVCFLPFHTPFLCVSVEFKVLDLICNLFVYCPNIYSF